MAPELSSCLPPRHKISENSRNWTGNHPIRDWLCLHDAKNYLQPPKTAEYGGEGGQRALPEIQKNQNQRSLIAANSDFFNKIGTGRSHNTKRPCTLLGK